MCVCLCVCVVKGYTADKLLKEFPSNSWIKRSVRRLLMKLRHGTIDRRPWSDRARTAPTVENVDLVVDLVLSQ